MSANEPRLAEYLAHMLEAVDWIAQFTAGMSEERFIGDVQCQHAVLRNIEVIGEAAGRIRTRFPSFADKHAEIAWRDIYGMRNRLLHGYFAINLRTVWTTIQNDLPLLKAQLLAAKRDAA